MTTSGYTLHDDEAIVLETRQHWLVLAKVLVLVVTVLGWCLVTSVVVVTQVWASGEHSDRNVVALRLFLIYEIPLVVALAIAGAYAVVAREAMIVGALCLAGFVFGTILGLAVVASATDLAGEGSTVESTVLVCLPTGLVTLIAGGYSLITYLRWRLTSYVVTDQRIILRSGVVRRVDQDLPLRSIQDVMLEQGIIARMLGFGLLTLESAGRSSTLLLSWVPRAAEVRATIRRLAADPPGI